MTATERSAKARTPPTTPATTGTIDDVCDEEDDGVEAGVAVGSESVVDSGPSIIHCSVDKMAQSGKDVRSCCAYVALNSP